jgi:acetyl-CoA carboxylase biotin carboxyl carrier protein
MIDLKQLKSLIKLMVDNGLTEVDLQDAGGEKVKLRRGDDRPVQYVAAPSPPAAFHQPLPTPGPASAAGASAPAAAPAAASDEGLVTITSPMVGTFYAASSPESGPFVSIGDRVSPDSVVCLIEAMKVFNEIKAETTGSIQAVLVSNGQAVEFGQALFKVKPG